jgi:hypothetical protein
MGGQGTFGARMGDVEMEVDCIDWLLLCNWELVAK